MADLIGRQEVLNILHEECSSMVEDFLKKKINAISSAQPEIVRCECCKYWEQETICEGYCHMTGLSECDEDHYCGYAEKRTEGETI